MPEFIAHFKSVQPDLGGSLPGDLIFGIPGFSPIVEVTQTDDGAVITITDKNGTTEAVIKNGKDGGTCEIPEGEKNLDYSNATNKPSINGVPLEGNKTSEELGIGQPSDEQVSTAVSAWLDEHPDATTTVKDGSVTPAKLSVATRNKLSPINCKIIAHRGYWATVPANTIAALMAGVENGFDWFEIDIRRTADGVYILSHDNTRTLYNAGKAVSVSFGSSNYADIKDYTWDAAGQYKLATLQAAFSALKMYGANFVCDKKSGTNEMILTIAAFCGVSDRIMLSYTTPSFALSEQAFLKKYPNVPLRVVPNDYNAMVTLMESVKNPIYADINASQVAHYQPNLPIALACHLPIIFSGCAMDSVERWAVLANGVMGQANSPYSDFVDALTIDYDATAAIVSNSSVAVAVGGMHTLEASSDLETAAGYVYGYSINPNIASVKQTGFGQSATLVITGAAEGTTIVRLFTGCGTMVDVSCTVSATDGGGDDSGDSGESGGEDGGETGTAYTITNKLTNVTTDNAAASVESGAAYTATLTAENGVLSSVTVTMGGEDITATVYSEGVISIPAVTGNVIITATATVEEGDTSWVEVENVVILSGEQIGSGATMSTVANRHTAVLESGDYPIQNYQEAKPYYMIPVPQDASKIMVDLTGNNSLQYSIQLFTRGDTNYTRQADSGWLADSVGTKYVYEFDAGVYDCLSCNLKTVATDTSLIKIYFA